MTDLQVESAVITTVDQLQHIKNSQPPHTQLRFISGTSINQTFGAICIVYEIENDAVLLVPYYLRKSHEQNDPQPVPENPESLAMRLLVKEAVLKSRQVNVLGSPLAVPDKKHTGQSFYKYVVLITKISPEDRVKIKSYSSKIGDPIWMKRELIEHVFEERPLIYGKVRTHPHYDAYKRFLEYFPLKSQLEKW